MQSDTKLSAPAGSYLTSTLHLYRVPSGQYAIEPPATATLHSPPTIESEQQKTDSFPLLAGMTPYDESELPRLSVDWSECSRTLPDSVSGRCEVWGVR